MTLNDANSADPGVSSADIYRAVRAAIQQRELERAHNLLRGRIREDGEDPEYLLLMAWTAPTQRTAQLIFRQFQRKHPDHPKAKGSAMWSGVAWAQGAGSAATSELAVPVEVAAAAPSSKAPAAEVAAPVDWWDRPAGAQRVDTIIGRLPVPEAAMPAQAASAAKSATPDSAAPAPALKSAAPDSAMPASAVESAAPVSAVPAPEKVRAAPAPVRRVQGTRSVRRSRPAGLAGWLAQVNFNTYLGVYMAGITLAEVLTTFVNPLVGLALHGGLLVVILMHTSLAEPAERKFLLALALAPLIRLMSLSMPLLEFEFKYWYMVIGLPLLVATLVVYRLSGYRRSHVGLSLGKHLPLQLVVAAAGVGLGYMEYYILKPEPLADSFSLQSVWLPAVILLVFTGFLEELIFRGLMQKAAADQLRKLGPFYISLLFAVLHIGYKSLIDLAFVFLVGFVFSLVAARTRSLLGVTISHGLTNISLFLIFPFVLAAPLQPEAYPVGIPVSPAAVEVRLPAMWVSPPTLTPRPTLVPTETPTVTPTPMLTSTLTALPPSPTASATATRYYVPPPIFTATWTVKPPLLPTNTPPATATVTLENTPTATSTPEVVLGTSVPIPPTATETPAPDANVLPTATQEAMPALDPNP